MSAPSDGARADARKRLAAEGPRWSDLFGIDPEFTDSEPPTLVIDSGWLCESVNKHTCGAGPGSYGGMHEPGCGLVPVANIADLLAGVLADAKAEVREQIAMEIEAKAAGNHAAFAADEDKHLIHMGEKFGGEWEPTHANRHDDGCGMCGLASAARIARGDS